MICYNCQAAPICRIYDIIKILPPGFIEIGHCILNNDKNTIKQQVRAPKDYCEIENRIEALSKMKNIDTKNDKKKKKECPYCKEIADLKECSKCGTYVCENCFVFNIANNEACCSNCWDTELC